MTRFQGHVRVPYLAPLDGSARSLKSRSDLGRRKRSLKQPTVSQLLQTVATFYTSHRSIVHRLPDPACVPRPAETPGSRKIYSPRRWTSQWYGIGRKLTDTHRPSSPCHHAAVLVKRPSSDGHPEGQRRVYIMPAGLCQRCEIACEPHGIGPPRLWLAPCCVPD